MKQLTLDLAATSFLGADIGPEVDEITRAFVDMVAASVARIRRPLPGTQMAPRRCRPQADRRLFLRTDSDPPRQRRRRRPVLATVPCDPRGRRAAVDPGHHRPHEFSDDGGARHADIVADLLCRRACRPPANGSRSCATKSKASASRPTIPPAFDNLEEMPLSEMAFKEALRLKPPVPSMPRRAVRDFHVQGVRDSRRHHGRRQSAVHAPHAGDLART